MVLTEKTEKMEKNGETGDDGYSPTANVTKVGKTATITITGDKSGDTQLISVTVSLPKYTVKFSSNGGTVVAPVQNVTSGTSLGANMPQNPVKTDYLFDRWHIDGLQLPFG